MFVYILATACLTCVLRTAATSCVVQATTHTQPPVRTKGSSLDLGGSSSAVVRYVQLTWTETLETNFGRSRCTNRRCRVDSSKMDYGSISFKAASSLFPTAFTCSANSNYSACMTSCPASCSDLAAPSECDATTCIEGCQCAAGFVMSEEACVPYRECGCTFLNRYYLVRLFVECAFVCVC